MSRWQSPFLKLCLDKFDNNVFVMATIDSSISAWELGHSNLGKNDQVSLSYTGCIVFLNQKRPFLQTMHFNSVKLLRMNHKSERMQSKYGGYYKIFEI